MAKTEQKSFILLDVHLAAFLELHGIPAQLENQNGKIIFNFPVSDDIYRLANAYNSNTPVKIADYIAALKILKAKMYTLRGQR